MLTNTSARPMRIIAPRKPLVGPLIDLGDIEDRTDSRTLLRRVKHVALPEAVDSWHSSIAARVLADFPPSAIWIPNWVACIAKHPTRAVLLSWLLSCFSDAKPKGKRKRVCRAQALDEHNHRWWCASRGRICAETLLEIASFDRARKYLVNRKLIDCRSTPRGLYLRPLAYGLSNAYYSVTGDSEAKEELNQGDVGREWFPSQTRRAAEKNAKGTRVPTAISVICDRATGPAMLLAHVLYWHGLNSDGRCRARIVRDERLWVARSQRQLMRNPGGDPASLAGYARKLAVSGLIEIETKRWSYDTVRDRGKPTLHIRPRPENIAKALLSRRQEIVRAIAQQKPVSQ